MIRAFVAFDLDAPTLDALGRMSTAVRAGAPPKSAPRWTSREQMHITAKFLGATRDEQADAMRDALASIAGTQAPRARVTGFGAFPSPPRAGVLLASVDDAMGDLERIARAADERAAALGFLREERRFLPHVTLARLRGPVDVRACLESAPCAPFDLGVRALTLYKSVLSSAGASYTPLASALFAG